MSSSSTQNTVEKPFYESCDYNKEPIGDVFEKLFATLKSAHVNTAIPAQGNEGISSSATEAGNVQLPISVLEVAAGSGQHSVYLTHRFPYPNYIGNWVPTDLPKMLPGIHRWISEDGKDAKNLFRGVNGSQLVPLSFTDAPNVWQTIPAMTNGAKKFDVVFTANSLHIASWEPACVALFHRLPLVLKVGGFFLCYGPFNYEGTFTTESNRRFDGWLKRTVSPESGIRDMERVSAELAAQGFVLDADHEMPDNNRCLQFRYIGLP